MWAPENPHSQILLYRLLILWLLQHFFYKNLSNNSRLTRLTISIQKILKCFLMSVKEREFIPGFCSGEWHVSIIYSRSVNTPRCTLRETEIKIFEYFILFMTQGTWLTGQGRYIYISLWLCQFCTFKFNNSFERYLTKTFFCLHKFIKVWTYFS